MPLAAQSRVSRTTTLGHMRALFEVVIRGGDERAATALRDGGLWVMGPPYNKSGDVLVGIVMALVKAADADAATHMVSQVLPNDDGYIVESVRRVGDEG